MTDDIRDNPYIDHKDVLGLNFIRDPGTYVYRRHYRQGMRSHIMEVLDPKDVENETKGIVIDGLKLYPRAQPLNMLRIFRTKFNALKNAEEELRRVKTIETYLAPDNLARSNEFLVDYIRQGKRELLLCGFQEYVKGEVLEPWSHLDLDKDHLVSLLYDMGFEKVEDSVMITDRWIHSMREKAENFIGKLKQMIMETNLVPDLAGVGNLLLTRSGDIKLVDINNISRVSFDPIIHLDDRGYPVCDKSIEALSLLEQKLLGRPLHRNDIIYKTFLDSIRMKEVQAIDKKFHRSMEPEMSSSESSSP
jgi:hypothetical protein